ncbi:MAG: amidohydrolase family protein, partial [Armatimonadota bacterium]
MNRRLAILAILGSLFVVPAPLQLVANAQLGDLPLIDAHDHLQRNISAESLIRLMDLVGVTRMVLMALMSPPENGSDRQALDYARRFPGRFLPFVGFQGRGLGLQNGWLQPDSIVASRILGEMEEELKGGGFFGLGEVIVRHYDYSLPQYGVRGGDGEINRPLDDPMMLRLADLATKYRVPMLIHAEGEPLVVAAMARFLRSHRNTRVVWAHNCGRSSAPEIRRLLADHANLYCDLAGMTDPSGYGSGWPRSGPWTFLVWDQERRIFPDMKEAFEAFPDRFLGVGTDSAHNGEWQYFTERIGRYRLLLSQLSPATAK